MIGRAGGYISMPVWKQTLFFMAWLFAVGLGGALIGWLVSH